MAVDIEKRAENAKGNTIFLSWSGEYSKEIARQLKDTIEELFEGKIICFFSEVDIPSGEEWYRKIHIELQKSAMGIMCITKGKDCATARKLRSEFPEKLSHYCKSVGSVV